MLLLKRFPMGCGTSKPQMRSEVPTSSFVFSDISDKYPNNDYKDIDDDYDTIEIDEIKHNCENDKAQPSPSSNKKIPRLELTKIHKNYSMDLNTDEDLPIKPSSCPFK